MAKPDYYANRILDALGVSAPRDLGDLEAIAWTRGLLVTYRPLRGAEARIAIHGRRGIITVSSTVTDPGRRRFSIAHELGHFEIHRRLSQLAVCATADLNDWDARQTSQAREHEANEFAAALLLPERFLQPQCQGLPPSLEAVSALAREYGASLTATARRFTDFTPEPCAVVFSQGGYSRWFQGSREFQDLGLFVDVKTKLDPSTSAVQMLHGQSGITLPRRVDASAWFKPGRYRRGVTLLEQTCLMPNLDAALTLLWVDEDIDGDEIEFED